MLLARPLGGSTQVSALLGVAIALFACAWIIRGILQAGGLRGTNIAPRWRIFSMVLLLVMLAGTAAFAVGATLAWIQSL
jgi:hypothetical protein